MNDDELRQALDGMRDLMISVATGGPRIGDVQQRFRRMHADVAEALRARGTNVALPDADLWAWHGRLISGGMPTYASRRAFVGDLFKPLLEAVARDEARIFEPTGWERVDRTVEKARSALARSAGEEDYQAIGLFCREALISVAATVWDPARHPVLDGVAPSATDAKRRFRDGSCGASGPPSHYARHDHSSLAS